MLKVNDPIPWVIDRNWLDDVYSGKKYGRQSGKSVAHATYILGVIEVNPEIDSVIITGKNFDHMRHFQMTLQRVMDEMEVPYTFRRLTPWTIAGRKVGFYPYGNVADKAEGQGNCLIYDSNDFMNTFFEPRMCDIYTIHDHLYHMKQMERLQARQAERSRQAQIQSDSNRRHQCRVQPKLRYTPSS